MNHLQICQAVGREAGLAAAGMTTTVSQTGENAQVIAWVDHAWLRIQSMRNWDWLWQSATVTILANTNATAGLIPASRYVKETTVNPSNVVLGYVPWQEFIRTWPSARIVAGTPSIWTIRPDKAFTVNAKPTANHALTVERYANPTSLSGNTESPALPAEHHMLIVWRAVMLYAGHDEAGALYQHADAERKKVLSAMGVTEVPAPGWECGW